MGATLLMPALSPTMTEGKLARWLKKEGDEVRSGDIIAEIETDKATMEVEAVDEGILGKILVPGGTQGVKVNDVIAVVVEEGEAVPSGAPAAAAPTAAPAAAPAAPPARPYAQEVHPPAARLRIALSTASPIGGAVDAAWSQAAADCGQLLQSLGHHVEWVGPVGDGMQLARDYLTMYFGQVAAQLRYWKERGVPPSAFETDTQALALIGRGLSAGDYALSRARWNAPMRALGALFSRFDLYLTPTCAQPPARIGELATPDWQRAVLGAILRFGLGGVLRRSGMVERLAFENLHRTPFTQLANLTGTPAMSVPWVLDPQGLPVGVQCTAAWGREDLLLQIASELEQAHPWAHWRPPIFAA